MGRCADKCVGDHEDCEDEIKERSKGRSDGDEPEDAKAPSMGAKSLCIPFEQPKGKHALVSGKTKCTQCGEDAKVCPVCSCPTECVLTVLVLALHALWKILLVGERCLVRFHFSLEKIVGGFFFAGWWAVAVSLLFVSPFRSGARFQCIPETQSRHRMPKPTYVGHFGTV